MKKSKIILFLGIILCVVGLASIVYAQTMAERLSGRILLQVEQNGEAWYVNPVDGKKYFMGRPQDAFNLMRELGLGITDSNLNQIPTAGTSGNIINSENWKPYTYEFFTFDYPSDWTLVNLDNQTQNPNEKAKFLDANGKTIATLTCPFTVTSYPGTTKKDDKNKTISDNYTAELMVLEGSSVDNQEIPDLGIVIMKRGQFNSCQLTTMDYDWEFSDMRSTYNAIYDSVR